MQISCEEGRYYVQNISSLIRIEGTNKSLPIPWEETWQLIELLLFEISKRESKTPGVKNGNRWTGVFHVPISGENMFLLNGG